MPHPATMPEILSALESNARSIAEYLASIPEPRLFDGDSDHWSPAHHLAHLTDVAASVGRALRAGALPLHPAARSRTYAEVRDAAATSLAATSKAKLLEMGRKVVIAPGTPREVLIEAFESASAELRAAAAAWGDIALDRHALRHPLSGELTVREMLFFVVVHERHHLKRVRTRVESSPDA